MIVRPSPALQKCIIPYLVCPLVRQQILVGLRPKATRPIARFLVSRCSVAAKPTRRDLYVLRGDCRSVWLFRYLGCRLKHEVEGLQVPTFDKAAASLLAWVVLHKFVCESAR